MGVILFSFSFRFKCIKSTFRFLPFPLHVMIQPMTPEQAQSDSVFMYPRINNTLVTMETLGVIMP